MQQRPSSSSGTALVWIVAVPHRMKGDAATHAVRKRRTTTYKAMQPGVRTETVDFGNIDFTCFIDADGNAVDDETGVTVFITDSGMSIHLSVPWPR